MKDKPSFDIQSDHFINENTPPDITTLSDITLKIQFPDELNYPERETKTWCSYMERGFRASRVMAGTQSGNQIDAPAQFIEREASSNKLHPDKLIK